MIGLRFCMPTLDSPTGTTLSIGGILGNPIVRVRSRRILTARADSVTTMASGEAAAPLLGDDETRWPRLRAALDLAPVKAFLDWAPLILFYALDGPLPFGVASAVALAAGVACMSATHLRSKLDPRVSSPKVLDVGFVVTFAAFTVAGFASARSAHVTIMWANALMDGALAAIVAAGVALDEPFTLPYAVEMGLPLEIARTPFLLRILSGAALEWCYAFAAMAAVSSVAPFYRCAVLGARDGAGCYAPSDGAYRALNAAFTYGAQYCILGGMMFKDFYLEPRHAKAVQAWVDRAPADYVAAHGAPHGADGAEQRVETKKGGATLATLRDDRAGGTDADVATAAKTLAAAFVDDPLMALWVTRAGQAPAPWSDPAGREARIAAMEKMFACTTRATRRFNHVFVVNGGASYCVCVPCWPEADAMERVNSNESYGTHKWPTECGMPPVEFMQIEKLMTRALGGREHLYIFHVGTDPASQGQGLGSVCMRAALRVADARGVPTALETMTNKNRALYEHYGFKVVGQIEVPECQDPWYGMIREPPADATTVTVNAPLHA